MLDMLYAFGIGISFSVGVWFGAYLCRASNNNSDWKEHQRIVEDRLSKYVLYIKSISESLEKIVTNTSRCTWMSDEEDEEI